MPRKLTKAEMIEELKLLLRDFQTIFDHRSPVEEARMQYLCVPELADFWADFFGVSVPEFERWRDLLGDVSSEFYLGGQTPCPEIVKGKTCGAPIVGVPIHPAAFIEGHSDRCRDHKRRLTDEERKLFEHYEYEVRPAEREVDRFAPGGIGRFRADKA